MDIKIDRKIDRYMDRYLHWDQIVLQVQWPGLNPEDQIQAPAQTYASSLPIEK